MDKSTPNNCIKSFAIAHWDAQKARALYAGRYNLDTFNVIERITGHQNLWYHQPQLSGLSGRYLLISQALTVLKTM